MKIKLLKDIVENGQIKVTVRKSRKTAVVWCAGVEMEMSDASAAKYIDAGLAVAVPAVEVTE